MSGGHTPGPWFTQDLLEPMGGFLARPILAQNTFIAHVVLDDENDAQAEANARLITAAPALLEALEAFPGYAADVTFAAVWKWLGKRDAAIAAAAGVEPATEPQS